MQGFLILNGHILMSCIFLNGDSIFTFYGYSFHKRAWRKEAQRLKIVNLDPQEKFIAIL